MEQRAEEFPQIAVVGTGLEMQLPAVVQIRGKLVGKPVAQLLDRGRELLLRDTLILLPLVGRLQALPGQRSQIEIHKYIAEGLEVVSARLLDPQMRVDGRIARGPGQVLVLSVRNMAIGSCVPELFGQPKINYVDQIALLA